MSSREASEQKTRLSIGFALIASILIAAAHADAYFEGGRTEISDYAAVGAGAFVGVSTLMYMAALISNVKPKSKGLATA